MNTNHGMNVRNVPYYKQLGYSSSIQGIRNILEKRIGLFGNAIRIESIVYTGKEAKSKEGCPVAKSVLRRSSDQEIVLALVRYRRGHNCHSSYIIVGIVVWDAIDRYFADNLYDIIVYKVNNFGIPTNRRCGQNATKTCSCQGMNPRTSGASYSFGCSWSMFYNGCKFRNSKHKNIRKFKMRKRDEELDLEYYLQQLATGIGPLYEAIAPDAYHNQIAFESEGSECRIGLQKGRPFSGVTACLDFCAHSHKDRQNMNNGCTAVVTLTKFRNCGLKPREEQFHVLPMYRIDSIEKHNKRVKQSTVTECQGFQALKTFPVIKRVLATSFEGLKTEIFIKTENSDKLKEIEKKSFNHSINYDSDSEKYYIEYFSDNESCFEDKSMGGLSIALSHRSVLFECAKHETHATTAVKHPNRLNPNRISLVFYQHKALNLPNHGFDPNKLYRKINSSIDN